MSIRIPNIILLIMCISCGNDHDNLACMAGHYLYRHTRDNTIVTLSKKRDTDYFIYIGSGLTARLNNIRDEIKGSYTIDVLNGDVDKAISGNKKATHLVIIKNEHKKLFGIRLNYDKKYGKFHILGYWTIDRPL